MKNHDKFNAWTLFLLLSVSAFAAEKPNIVVLLADDLGYKDIGCYDGPVKTPNLDRLAARGVKFSDFYSGCAVCSPSRATLLTGRHHIRTGVYSWIQDSRQNSHLLEREVTIAEILKEEGYATAHFGKWHLGLSTEKRPKPSPAEHGFDYWFATALNAVPSHRDPTNFIRNGEAVGEIKGYSAQIVVDEAIDWLDNREGQNAPFFLNVWFHEPHAPLAAPARLEAQYAYSEEEKKNISAAELRRNPALYSATIDNTDRAIGRLLKKLAGIAPVEDTLIIYSSDNGSYMDTRTGGLRGVKGANWEGGIRVPGIFSWPGKIPTGKTLNTPAGLVDILPTLCAVLGRETPQDRHIDGSNIAPLLMGKAAGFKRHQPLFWHLQKSRPIVAMRDGNYSLVADPDYELSTNNMFDEAWIPKIKSGGYKNFQLFDLSKDPNQTDNIASKNPGLVKKMKKELLKINASIMAEGADWHLE